MHFLFQEASFVVILAVKGEEDEECKQNEEVLYESGGTNL